MIATQGRLNPIWGVGIAQYLEIGRTYGAEVAFKF